LDRQDGPDKVVQLLLLPIEKARKKKREGALKAALKSEVLIPYYCPREVGPRRHKGV